MLDKKQVAARFTRDGSIFALKALNADKIEDAELKRLWFLAQVQLRHFENAEDDLAEYLERPTS